MSFLTLLIKPVAYLSLPVFLLHTASNRSPLARYYVRLGLYISSLGLASMWGAIASIGLSLVGRRLDTNWTVAKFFYGLASRAVGIQVDLEGEEHLSTKPAIIIGNHQSMLDILYLGKLFPKQAVMTAKKQLQWVPVFGQFLTLAGAIFIDRANGARAVQAVATAGEKMKAQGTSIWMFPEGTRTNEPHADLKPFKKGAFYLAVQAGVPIIPVVCENYWVLYHKGTFECGRMKVKILPPIPTSGLTSSDVPDLVIRVREQMLSVLKELSVAPPSSPVQAPAQAMAEPAALLQPASELPFGVNVPAEAATANPLVEPAQPEPLSVDTSVALEPKRDGSDKGVDTEEDEGMVLVGRPSDSD